jgi:hypothetical protein
MIEAVAEEKASFQDSVHQFAQYLVAQLGQLSAEDPQILQTKETLAKVAYFLKEDFHSYFQAIFPSLLEDSKQQIDIKLTSAEDPSEQEEAGVNIKIKGFEGPQRLTMNTSALESKLTAFKLMHLISENMGTSFKPYCEAVLPVVLGDLSYKFSKAIRKYAMKTCVNILHAAGEPINVAVF